MLLVEDEPDVRLVTGTYLRAHGYGVIEAGDGRQARRCLDGGEIDVVVLDLGLPDEDGLGLLRELRTGPSVPVVVVTGRGEEPDRVVGLELGADDYVVKPFSQRELVARIKAVLRRARPAESANVLRFGPLSIDLDARETFVHSEAVMLTRLEYELLVYLASSPGRSYSREQLLNAVWASSSEWQRPDTVSEHIHRLRRKLAMDHVRPRIATVRGVGYRFDP
ncbi:MAG: response regulator transcription factor [Solirubrobacteraceae bacterium]